MCLVLAQLMACWGTATCLPAPQVHQTTLGGGGGRHTSKRPATRTAPAAWNDRVGTFFFSSRLPAAYLRLLAASFKQVLLLLKLLGLPLGRRVK
uniref:Putative secreted protein n=1 Tax=Rhipicephalus microplus TaxID=6941 RepID=A0A6G5A402_RHIMP